MAWQIAPLPAEAPTILFLIDGSTSIKLDYIISTASNTNRFINTHRNRRLCSLLFLLVHCLDIEP